MGRFFKGFEEPGPGIPLMTGPSDKELLGDRLNSAQKEQEDLVAKYPGFGQHWVTRPWHKRKILGDNDGTLGAAAGPANTLLPSFFSHVGAHGSKTAFKFKTRAPDGSVSNSWDSYSYAAYWDAAVVVARGLVTLGHQPFDPVAVLGFNSPEWCFAAMGSMLACGSVAGVYTTSNPDAVKYILDYSKTPVIFLESEAQYQKLVPNWDSLEHLKAVVIWGQDKSPSGSPSNVYGWEEFIALAREKPGSRAEVDRRMAGVKPHHCATIIFTSGTTGPPKSVMISQDTLAYGGRIVPTILSINSSDTILSYLPLSHIAAQIIDLLIPIVTDGATVVFPPDESVLRGKGLRGALLEVRPTIFLGVPRVWEKMKDGILEVAHSNGGLLKSIAAWGKDIGARGVRAQQAGKSKPWGWALATMLVFKTVRKRVGLDRCRYYFSGAAPLDPAVQDYFASLGAPIWSVYGLSECTGLATANTPVQARLYTVGRAIPGGEVRIDSPDEEGKGEVCIRGRHLMMGYMGNPEATEATFDAQGWLHSGDVGMFDAASFLKITGRTKELLVTAGGENIPPTLIEAAIKSATPVVSQVVVVGDQRPYLVALVTLKALDVTNPVPGVYEFTDDLAQRAVQDLTDNTAYKGAPLVSEASKDPVVIEHVTAGIRAANQVAASRAQQVHRFALLDQDISVMLGDMTPTMKLKRSVIIKKHAELIDSMYSSDWSGPKV